MLSSCYEPTRGKSIGWCATCVPEAKKGEPGYCGKGQNLSTNEDENTEILTVTPDSNNWGICDSKCRIPKAKDENELHVRYSYNIKLSSAIEMLSIAQKCLDNITV